MEVRLFQISQTITQETTARHNLVPRAFSTIVDGDEVAYGNQSLTLYFYDIPDSRSLIGQLCRIESQ